MLENDILLILSIFGYFIVSIVLLVIEFFVGLLSDFIDFDSCFDYIIYLSSDSDEDFDWEDVREDSGVFRF